MTGDEYCLRRWPESVTDEHQLSFIHETLRCAVERGVDVIPVPLPSRDGKTMVRAHQAWWELAPWMPGSADYQIAPSRARLENALRVLAQFHRAVSSLGMREGTIPGILDRLRLAESWTEEKLRVARERLQCDDSVPFSDRLALFLDAFTMHGDRLRERLHAASRLRASLQICVRDVRAEHFLFVGEQVSGFVDFGALRIDHVGLDLARLLGSFVGDDRETWLAGIACYRRFGGSWSDQDGDLLNLLDSSNLLLSGLNWVRWLLLEKREFPSQRAVQRRMDEIAPRVQRIGLNQPLG
jgi:homoserine kinase type II